MKNPITENKDNIVIDKNQVESLSKRFLSSVYAFFFNLIGKERFERLGLNRKLYFKVFLCLAVAIGCYFAEWAVRYIAFGTIVITVIWIYRRNPDKDEDFI